MTTPLAQAYAAIDGRAESMVATARLIERAFPELAATMLAYVHLGSQVKVALVVAERRGSVL